jgi:hypothetical protein
MKTATDIFTGSQKLRPHRRVKEVLSFPFQPSTRFAADARSHARLREQFDRLAARIRSGKMVVRQRHLDRLEKLRKRLKLRPARGSACSK